MYIEVSSDPIIRAVAKLQTTPGRAVQFHGRTGTKCVSTSAVTAFASELQEWLKKGGVRRPMVDRPFGLLTPDEPQSFLQRQQGLTEAGARIIVALLRQQYAILGFVSAQSVSVIADFAVWKCAARRDQSSPFIAGNHHESPSPRNSVSRPYRLETLPPLTRHPAFQRT